MMLSIKDFLQSSDRILNFEGNLKKNESDYIIDGLGINFPISYKGHLYNLDDELKLDLLIEYEYNTKCDRCLKEMQNHVKTKLESYFIKDLRNIDDDAMTEYFTMNDEGIFLDDLIISQVITSMPGKVLCKEDCKGICPKCGKDLNQGPCDCKDESQVDPRFENLLNLFK